MGVGEDSRDIGALKRFEKEILIVCSEKNERKLWYSLNVWAPRGCFGFVENVLLGRQ